MRYLSLLFILLLGLTACQTNQLKQFEKLKVGMDKDDILDIMGSPQATQRWRGMDRWTFKFYQDDQLYLKEVHFSESISKYIGEVYKPEVSAEEQDRVNAAANQELDSQVAAKKEEIRKEYSDYEAGVRGENEVRYVPSFTPVQ